MVTAAELRNFVGVRTIHSSSMREEVVPPHGRRKGRLEEAGSCAVMMLGISLSLLIIGCDGSKPGSSSHELTGGSPDNKSRSGPIIHSAAIIPLPLTRNVPLAVQVEADAPSLGAVTVHYQWIINGVSVVGETNQTFDPTQLKRGDQVSVDLIPVAASGQGPPFHVEGGVVQNSPPVIRAIAFQPSEVRVNTPLQAYAEVVDVDHDPVRLTFRWRRNDQVVKEGDEALLNLAGFRPGDVIVVEATPADLDGMGQTVRSEPVTIQNSPPTVTTVPTPPTNLDKYEYAVHAIDPDGDPMRFSLISAPLGMTIGEHSGLMVWRIPPGLKGTHNAQIAIEDNRGGSAIQDIQLTLPAPAES